MNLKNISGPEAAALCKVNKSQISKIINGDTKNPRPTTIERIAKGFGCNVMWFRTGEGKPFPKPSTAGHTMSGITNSDGNVQAGGDVMYTMTRSGRKTGNKGNLDDDILNKIRAWLDETERTQPGYKAWFRIEIQHRFPEFAEWIAKDSKKQIT